MGKKLLLLALLVALLIPGIATAVTLHSEQVNFSALVFYDTLPFRWVKIIGADTVSYMQDFASLPTDDTTTYPTEWTTTLVDGSIGGADSAGIGTTAGGVWSILTNADDDDGQNMQLTGESFLQAADKPLYFGIKLQIDEATESDFIVGDCITDTDLLGGMTDGIYFRKVDGSLNIAFVTEVGSAETESLAVGALADNTYVTLEFYAVSNTWVKAYINGVLVATHTAGITAEELTPSVHFLTGEGVAHTMSVDWLHAGQVN